MLFLMFVTIATTSLSFLSLNQLLALRADVEVLKTELLGRRRDEQQDVWHTIQTFEQMSTGRGQQGEQGQAGRSDHVTPGNQRRRRRRASEPPVTQPCLQMLADSNRGTFQKEFASEQHTSIPWQTGLSRGNALELENNRIVVREDGFYYLYSQVYYRDSTFAMGHVVIRRKRNVVGDEPQHVVLFRCIQNMNPVHSFNTCYTGGVVKLEVNDQVELLIPRPTANVSLDAAATFLGAFKLA
ncbi:hypothetical protein CRUP_035699 [Coryphaenoides rupestris]|nr:hypothetical protein CRUP_035699 [Coryphaenoides rupestris]